jgi:hypothetical protein
MPTEEYELVNFVEKMLAENISRVNEERSQAYVSSNTEQAKADNKVKKKLKPPVPVMKTTKRITLEPMLKPKKRKTKKSKSDKAIPKKTKKKAKVYRVQ